MAGELYPVAGCRFFIGGVISVGIGDLVLADFDGQVFTEVDGYTTMGAIGDTAALITQPLINRGRDYKQKGTANAPSQSHNFAVVKGDAGQEALIAAAAPGDKNNYAIRILLNDAPVARSSVATITVAAPGVVTWADHGLAVGDKVRFTTTGALPTGLTAGTTYFVKTVPDEDTFTVSETLGGTAITTSSTQSGVHTVITVPTPSERLFAGLIMSASEQGGDANTMRLLATTVEVNSNTVNVASTPGT